MKIMNSLFIVLLFTGILYAQPVKNKSLLRVEDQNQINEVTEIGKEIESYRLAIGTCVKGVNPSSCLCKNKKQLNEFKASINKRLLNHPVYGQYSAIGYRKSDETAFYIDLEATKYWLNLIKLEECP